MKSCLACGKGLPDSAIICVFCKARQRSEEVLEPTPVQGVPIGLRPAEAVAALEAGAGVAAAAAPVEERRPPRPEGSRLIRLPLWNRNERVALGFGGGLLLLAALLGNRSPLTFAMAVVIAATGAAPIPRLARGLLASIAGCVALVSVTGWPAAFALTLLPGALLARVKQPASRLARLFAVAGAAAVLASYLVPRDGVSLGQLVLSNLRGDAELKNLVSALYLVLPVALTVMGLLAVAPKRVAGGCLLWATLALAWAPLGLLVAGWWGGSLIGALGGSLLVLAGSMSAALGIAELAPG